MSADPSLQLQTAIIAALQADGPTVALLGGAANIFDAPSGNPPYPHITVGDGTEVPDQADGGYDGADEHINVHVWARQDGSFDQAKQIAAAVKATLADGSGLGTDANVRVVQLFPTGRHDLRDPDGQTVHIVMMFCAFTEPA